MSELWARSTERFFQMWGLLMLWIGVLLASISIAVMVSNDTLTVLLGYVVAVSLVIGLFLMLLPVLVPILLKAQKGCEPTNSGTYELSEQGTCYGTPVRLQLGLLLCEVYRLPTCGHEQSNSKGAQKDAPYQISFAHIFSPLTRLLWRIISGGKWHSN